MQRTPPQLQVLADDLRRLIYKLAGADSNEHQAWLTSTAVCLTGVAERSLEQTRADACLLVVQAMLNMGPGESFTVNWHDRSTHPDGRMATLTIRKPNAESQCSP